MSGVLSERWHRVAALRPRLVPQLRVRRHQQRGQPWWLLVEPASGRSLRLTRAAYDFAARLDGRQRIDALWQAHRPVTGSGSGSSGAPAPSGRQGGNIGQLTLGRLDRSAYGAQAILCALVPFLHVDLYD